jgi:hypothetical protein
MSFRRKCLGEGLTVAQKQEIAIDMIEDLMKDGYHLVTAIKILENYYCGNVNLKNLLKGTKFDIKDGNHIAAIIWDGKQWSEIKSANFIFLVSNSLAILLRDIISSTKISIYDASCIILEHLHIPMTEENFETFGKLIKSTLKRTWVWHAKIVSKEDLWKSAFGKYKRYIEFYNHKGCDISKILNKETINILQLQLEKEKNEKK